MLAKLRVEVEAFKSDETARQKNSGRSRERCKTGVIHAGGGRSCYRRVMRRLLTVVMVACGGSQPPSQDPASPSQPLNEVELECRSQNNLDIGQLDAHFGPRCRQRTMPLSLKEFDLGTAGGLIEAKEWTWAKTMLCICSDGTCDERNEQRAIELARKTMVENEGKRLRAGVYRETESTSTHPCLNAAIAGELYKIGFQCGFVTGMRSQLLYRQMVADFAAIYQSEPDRGKQRADACFWGQVPELRPRAE